MPEGDTVWRAARNLDRALAGQAVISSDFRVPQLAVADLSGATVLGVVARGKHILMRFSTQQSLHSHLRMDGDWILRKPGSPLALGRPAHEVRVVLTTTAWVAWGVHLHDLALVPTDREDEQVGNLGPDLLAADFDAGLACAQVSADPRSIGEALLSQRNLAGIGNLYKNEVCFLHGIDPATPAALVTVVPAMVRSARKLLLANREHPEQSTTGSLRRGETHWVYGRGGKPCRRCGTRILQSQQGDGHMARVTYWCPRCQPPVV